MASTRNDDRLNPKDLVVGLQGERGAIAYPFRLLKRHQVVNDSFEGRSIVVVFEPQSGTGVIFDRTVAGRELTFEPATPRGGTPFIKDDLTGSAWNALTGEAIDGSLTGLVLQRVPATYAFWFGWSDYFPDTELFTGRRSG